MLDRFMRKFSRSKSEAFVSKLDGEHEDRELARQTTFDPSRLHHDISRLSLTQSDKDLVTKLSFALDQPLVERAPRRQTPSLATKWSERTVFNNIESGFLALPTEILLFLQPYLSLCSEVSLRQTCSRFYHLYSTHSFYLSGEDKFTWICMVERDQEDKRALSRLVCGYCRQLHAKSAFPSSKIDRTPLDRDCRQVWTCPHRSMGFEKTVRKIKAGTDSPFRTENFEPCNKCRETIRNRSVADRPERMGGVIDMENPNAQSMLITKIALLQAPSPAHATRGSASGMYTETFPAKDVSDALQALNFPICPHVRLGDPLILSKFCRACIRTHVLAPGTRGPPCISAVKDRDLFGARKRGKCKGECYIRGCQTKFMFQAKESLAADASGKRQVWLIIVAYRWLGPLLRKGKDRTWTEHAISARERPEMRVMWEKWVRACQVRPCMPNWSICLVHPEDCNLRWASRGALASGSMNAIATEE